MSTRRKTWLGQAALAAAEAGHYVFPVQPRGKVPTIKGWEQAATRDPDQIRDWWTQQPRSNIGIAVGRAGMIVIDLDTRPAQTPPPHWAGARNGADVLARLAHEAGEPLPDTYTVRTPSGKHLYFTAPTGVELRNTQGETGLGYCVDTRGIGGFVVGAGSVRAEGRYKVAHPGPVAPLPDWLVRALTPPPVVPRQRQGSARVSPGRGGAYARVVLTDQTARVAHAGAAGPGTRHRTLLIAAIKIGGLIAAGWLSDADARAALSTAAAGYIGVAGYTARQIERDISDGFTYAANATPVVPDRFVNRCDDLPEQTTMRR
jgi:hypothetical protein